MYQINRVQLIHQNGDTHFLSYKTDERVNDLEEYRNGLIRKYHCQMVNLTYTEIEKH